MSSTELHEPSKPSLIHPDLSGLWSYSQLSPPKDKKWWSKPVGTFVLFLLVHLWIGAFCIPWIMVFILYFEYYTFLLCFGSFILFPYLFPNLIKPSPLVCKFLILGAHYFDGGATMAYERPRPKGKDLKKPGNHLLAYHPHGIFVLGGFFNSGHF